MLDFSRVGDSHFPYANGRHIFWAVCGVGSIDVYAVHWHQRNGRRPEALKSSIKRWGANRCCGGGRQTAGVHQDRPAASRTAGGRQTASGRRRATLLGATDPEALVGGLAVLVVASE